MNFTGDLLKSKRLPFEWPARGDELQVAMERFVQIDEPIDAAHRRFQKMIRRHRFLDLASDDVRDRRDIECARRAGVCRAVLMPSPRTLAEPGGPKPDDVVDDGFGLRVRFFPGALAPEP